MAAAAKQPLDFLTPARDLGVLTAFTLDGETLHAVEPKAAQMMALVRGLGDLGDDMSGQGEVIDAFMDLCMTEETATRLRERMEDPQDPFDVDTLTEIIQGLQAAWSRRPTTPSATSSPRPTRTGKASTARRQQAG